MSTTTRSLLSHGVVAAAAGTTVNAALYGLGRAADLSFVIDRTAGDAGLVHLADVVSLSLMCFAAGLVAVLIANRVGRPSLRSLSLLGAVIAVGSVAMDLPIDASPAAKATLAAMHLVVGASYATALRRAGRTSAPEEAVSVVRSAPQPVAA